MHPVIQGFLTLNADALPPLAGIGEGLARIDFSGGMLAVASGVSVFEESGWLCAAWGTPRFNDGHLAARQRRSGAAAAWLQAYRAAGSAAAQRVSGRFAVVLLDTARRRCWMAVDRFGTLPLCYALDEGRLAFSDRADAVPGAPRGIEGQAVFDYLFFHTIPAPETIFRGVSRLPAGHALAAEGPRLETERYWTPQFEEPRDADFPRLQAEFLELAEEAVEREAAGHRDVGAFLSGGTDSSTVSGMLCRVLGRPAPTYSIGFDAEGYDEMGYARIAARHFGTDHHEYYVTPEDLLGGIPRLAVHFDQPFGNSSALAAWVCASRARAQGVGKMLAGDGGDELFGGNSRYARQRIFDWYGAVPAPLRRLLEPAAPLLARLPLLRKGARYIEQARVPLPDRAELGNLLPHLGTGNIFEPAFLKEVDQERPARLQRQTWSAARARAPINRMLAYDWKYTLADNDLPKVVGAAGLAGVEVGFPLLADELVDFSLRLPPQWKLKGLTLRWFFKRALRGFLPREIIAKKKHGFGLPFGVWALEHRELNNAVHRALTSFATRGIVREDFTRRLLRELMPAHPGYYGEMAWIMMVMEYWLREHHACVHGTPPARRQRAPAVGGKVVFL